MSAALPPDKISRRRRLIRSFEAKSLVGRNRAEKIADFITAAAGSIPFLILNTYLFLIWILLNVNVIPGIEPFDPFPFGLLTMIVSLEAIFLSIFVLLSQNRAAHIARLREELVLQVNLITEEEITKALEILERIQSKVGIKKEDPELTRMLERINTSYIEQSLQKQIDIGTGNFFGHIIGTSPVKKDGKQAKTGNGEQKIKAI